MGFSVDLDDKWDDTLGRLRTLLRIHPDGGKPGTAGCVGILDKVKECNEQLERLFPNAKTIRRLSIEYVKSRDDMMLVTPDGAFVWGD